MASNAPATIRGNVVRDPELFELGSGAVKAQFSVASERRYMKGGEWTGDTSFFNVVVWRDLARNTVRLIKKGVPVVVTGYWQQRTWETDDGTKRSTVEIVGDTIAVELRGIETFTRPERSAGSAGSSNVGGGGSEPEDAPW